MSTILPVSKSSRTQQYFWSNWLEKWISSMQRTLGIPSLLTAGKASSKSWMHLMAEQRCLSPISEKVACDEKSATISFLSIDDICLLAAIPLRSRVNVLPHLRQR
jgi:hypothetical protein